MSGELSQIPQTLLDAMKPITVVFGHYGTGKTNFALNLACSLVQSHRFVSLIDLDIVNPYFRASEQRRVLEDKGVHLIAPVFSEAGTNLDVPSLTGAIMPALQDASDDHRVIIDVGGDDAGAAALGRFAKVLIECGYSGLVVLNKYRNLVQDPFDAIENIREIEATCGLLATGLVSNAHLKQETNASHILEGADYAEAISRHMQLPLVAVTLPPFVKEFNFRSPELIYPVTLYVCNPWE